MSRIPREHSPMDSLTMSGATTRRNSGLTKEQRRLRNALATPLTPVAIFRRLKELGCPGLYDLEWDRGARYFRLQDQMMSGQGRYRWAFIKPSHAEAIMRDLMAKWIGEAVPSLHYLADKVMELEVRKRERIIPERLGRRKHAS